jgi:hypothetical protein
MLLGHGPSNSHGERGFCYLTMSILSYHLTPLPYRPMPQTSIIIMVLLQGPSRVRGPTFVPRSGKLRLLVPLRLPSVALLHICSKPTESPGQVGTYVGA